MSGFASLLLIALLFPVLAAASGSGVMESVQSDHEVSLTLDPSSPFWQESHPVFLDKNKFGKAVTRFRTEVRTRWTKNSLYFLFSCPYEELYLKPDPSTQHETNKLWDYDVAEVFIGSDFADIQRYKEFEVSPQGEWVDLDINLHKPHHEEGWTWNSGLEAAARIDKAKHIWYAAMRIPFSAIDERPAAPGNTLRINLFLSQGPPSNHQELAWQPPMQDSFHVPEQFGLIRLVKK